MEVKAPAGYVPVSARLFHCLKDHGIESLEDLSKITRRQAGKIPHIGAKTLAEMDRLLAEHGLSFTPDPRTIGGPFLRIKSRCDNVPFSP